MKLAILLLIAVVSLRSQETSRPTEPKPIRTAVPQYTQEALAAKLQGDVILTSVIGPDGVPSEIKLFRGLGMGLDEKAVECLQQWRFKPAVNYFWEPVAAKVTVMMNFRLPSPSKSK